ncbi:purine-nucleoside phosphorylase [Tessaracoccus sp. OH4464_COT-324]|uniref:purine-nucleoside phosphorylase n=1 Tax=Tessaracoccus sp. OH4464_COT-324 TaxID=2491059 RepID=UPI000F643BF7|nr:purine-nucleoside phosphorylase [Tessaracoccus sp. OH4464_COT-324]RRD44744.1 purine-nucleoside phosphorylase [Tessaracoccus sp. OH4464_COT-324]
MTQTPYELAEQAANHLRGLAPQIDIALVLGSGWSAGDDRLGETLAEVELGDVPGFAKPVVAGHGGKLRVTRTAGGKTAAVFTGRTHYYEGRGVAPVVHGVRTAARWGAKTLVLTNGCGGLNPAWAPGTVVLIRDHINMTGDTPLVGATFIDMTEAYSKRLRDLAHGVDPTLPEGVYVQFRGPQYETPAEVRMATVLGGDLVGMSTTLETLAAREAGLEVLGLSLVTNAAAGMTQESLDHAEVLQTGKDAGERLATLLSGIVAAL